MQLANHGRPNRGAGHTSAFRLAARTWLIPTRSAQPHSRPHAISEEVVRQVLAVREQLKSDNPRRPLPTRPGELVQTDTIHHVDPFSGKRLYIYTVIDLHTRMAYAMLLPRLGAGDVAEILRFIRMIRSLDAFALFALSMLPTTNRTPK